MVIHGQQEGLFLLIRPPRVEGGIMRPEFVPAGPLPAAAGFGEGLGRTDQEREVSAGVSGDRFAVTDGSVERLVEELAGETFGELMFCPRPVSGGVARRAGFFVGLRKARPCGRKMPAFLGASTPVSFCFRPNT